MRFCNLFFLFFLISTSVKAETIGLFSDNSIPQIKFAADDIKVILESKGYEVEMIPLSKLKSNYSKKKVVIAMASNSEVAKLVKKEDGLAPTALGEQAYCLRTTNKKKSSYYVLGGDANGAMYGGLQIAENINFNGFSGTYNTQETPAILKRGIKLNLPFDKRCPTYGKSNMGGFEGTSYKEAIPHVWDMNFWTEWFDEMARNRYNTVSIWSCHPFTSLIKLDDYPDVAINDVEGFNGYFKKMTIDEKIEFWRKVMKYAHERGFEFYLFNWNVFTYGATGKYGIDDKADNPATIKYMHKCMIKLYETYPDLDGFGITNGENKSTQEFLWETYGKGTYDYAIAHPERKIRFIHRWHWADLKEIKSGFNQLISLPNVTFDMSYKYSIAHMYSVPVPKKLQTDKVDKELRTHNLKTWLTVRNDVLYYHNWGDPAYARDYVNGMIGLGDDIFRGFYMGSDGYCPTRSFFSKDTVSQNILDIKRQWYMYMLWGRLSYNPNTPDKVFENQLALKYPTVPSDKLFTAWSNVSSTIPKITELIQGSWTIDLLWWLEGCNAKGSFRTAENFIKCKVADGSLLCSIKNSALDSCNGGKSSYQLADEIEADAKSSLSLISDMKADKNSELGVALNNIKAMSYMTIYFAYKIRGATYLAAKDSANAKNVLGNAYCWWMNYTNLMDSMYHGMDMQRVKNMPNWHDYDQFVLKEFTDLGGEGIPNCK